MVGVLNGLFLSIEILFSFHCLAQRQQHCLEFVSESASLVFFSRIHGPNKFSGHCKLMEQYWSHWKLSTISEAFSQYNEIIR